ncbi:helix-turn-helix transcriptional regulator [Undibacterium sp. TJN25]|uniref:helix-turn-helix transcriptional regulator n=1 Tax=Undibacterium sp. TJN25 TaxID=3413056 RepID=UPI003BF08AD7
MAERKAIMGALHSVVQMLGGMVGPHVEVALHDLTTPEVSVAALANGHILNHKVGAASLMGADEDQEWNQLHEARDERGAGLHTVKEAYATVTSDNRRLKSATVIFRDSGGEAFAALCLNADMSQFEMAHAWLGQLLQPLQQASAVAADKPEMDVLIQEIISDAVRRTGKPLVMMSKREKISAVRAMQQRGFFVVKGGVERAAGALGVSRFTIYNYLEALRQEDGLAG